eukprot:Nitzschia sp. Nitz4//scaffold25_size161228//123082//124288//NITZ4_002449-RA/size161228-augustus-gene-0.116-mRNA-1//1//CDS//3329544643//5199//frame0
MERTSKTTFGDELDENSDYLRLEDGRAPAYGRTKYYSPRKSVEDVHPSRSPREDYYAQQRGGLNKSSSSFSQSEDFRKMLKEEKGYESMDSDDKTEVYLVQQRYGYMSLFFSAAQTIILIVMMTECGVAPMNINLMFGPYPDALSEWGAKNAYNILEEDEWWRLVTPILLHAGVIHLLCNIAVQLDTGAFFEREWGSTKWLIIYLSSAVGSSTLSMIFMPEYISVGSSGSVMGLFGAKLAEVICRFCESDRTEQGRIGHQVRKEQCVAASCSVAMVMAFSFVPYVDWSAHLGGLIGGFCVGMILFSLDIVKQVWKLFWLLAGIAMSIVFFTVSIQHMYSGAIDPDDGLKDVCGYYKEFFDDYECNCMREEHGGA